MEKRKSKRVFKRVEVIYKTDIENNSITSNLSKTGLFIRTKRKMLPGCAIQLKLVLPECRDIVLTGKVVRSKRTEAGLVGSAKSGFGIDLISPSQDYLNYLHSCLL
jgi:hypothetical protein